MLLTEQCDWGWNVCKVKVTRKHKESWIKKKRKKEKLDWPKNKPDQMRSNSSVLHWGHDPKWEDSTYWGVTEIKRTQFSSSQSPRQNRRGSRRPAARQARQELMSSANKALNTRTQGCTRGTEQRDKGSSVRLLAIVGGGQRDPKSQRLSRSTDVIKLMEVRHQE